MKNASALWLINPGVLLLSLSVLADDVSDGRDYFLKNCIACHSFACNRDGSAAYAPKLGGLIGRKIGSVEDFTGYSEGFKSSEVIFNDQTLDIFFQNPGVYDPESVMADFGVINSAEDRQKIIAYLKTEDPSVDLFCDK